MQRDTGGVRKVRVATQGEGKSGGARVAYPHVRVRATIYLLPAFPKNVQANLTTDQKKALRKLLAKLRRRPDHGEE